MIRYSLRNQDKIIKAYDKDTLNRIITSLDEYFSNGMIKIEHFLGEKYGMLTINDSGHTCGLILFHVISFHFGNYRLALKEFCG